MKNYLRISRTLLFTFGLIVASMQPVAAASKQKKVPVGVKLNKIIIDHFEHFAEFMNARIENGVSDKDLKRYGPEDQKIYAALIEGLKRRKGRFVAVKDTLVFYSIDGKSTVKLVDYINGKYLIDGKAYTFKKGSSFKENLIAAGELFHKRATSLFNLFIMDEAHAVLPLLIIPGWAWVSAAAAGAVTFAADTTVSAGANDIANNHPNVRLKIQELTDTYRERADVCEADLAQAQAAQTQTRLASNNTVRMVGALIDGLGAELEDTFMDFDGKEELNYDDFGCQAHDGRDGIRNRQLVGLFSGFEPHGEILRGLCDHQERLNNCFSSTEEVMRENAIRINDLPGPDRIGPYDGLLEDYIEMQDATSR